jgi:hypothetical protein
MCTNEQRDEIVAEILSCHTGMPRGYAAWLVRQLDDLERDCVTRAAIFRRRAKVRSVQEAVHKRLARDRKFPNNLVTGENGLRRQRRRRLNSCHGQGVLFKGCDDER